MNTRHVDRFEVNEYHWTEGAVSRQLIIWNWSDATMRYEAERFYFLKDDGRTDPYLLPSGRWRFVRIRTSGRKADVFESESLSVSKTDYDPWKAAMERQEACK